MKIGIVGKGGVGKTTTSSLLARVLVDRGRRVLAVDTDSNPNLGLSLGLSPDATESLEPIPRSMVVGRRGDMTVSELMEDFAVLTPEGVTLMSALRVSEAGAGCTCGGHASVRSLLGEALHSETDDTIVDMEAGIEHLSRSGGTLAHADVLVLMMEPSRKAIITAQRTIGLAKELGIKRCVGVGNRVEDDDARQALEEMCGEHDVPLDVVIPSSSTLAEADRRGIPMSRESAPEVWTAIEALVDRLDVGAYDPAQS